MAIIASPKTATSGTVAAAATTPGASTTAATLTGGSGAGVGLYPSDVSYNGTETSTTTTTTGGGGSSPMRSHSSRHTSNNMQQQHHHQQYHGGYRGSGNNNNNHAGGNIGASPQTPSGNTAATMTTASSGGGGGGSYSTGGMTPSNNSGYPQHQYHQQQSSQYSAGGEQQTYHSSTNSHYNKSVASSVGGGQYMPPHQQNGVNIPQQQARAHPQHKASTTKTCFGCIECYHPEMEKLEYDYSYDDTNKPPQPYPRIRERGEYYIDSYNDQPWSFSFGTAEHNGIWCNSSDQAGSIMSALVWVLMLYSAFTVTALTVTEGIPVVLGMLYTTLCFMALACHAKTSLTDPGSVPVQAIPGERQRLMRESHSMCGQCQTFKPPGSHHCRICNRCISRMDHHCPWMNNCVGAANLKHFILFLIYTWTCAAFSLALFGWNYFFCSDDVCIFHHIVLHLVRIMTVLAIGAFLFTSSMLMNVCYGLMTGIGTIDRLKKKATNTMSQSDEEPIQLIDVFGITPFYTWLLPVDPIFEDYDRVMGYTMPQRLDRERLFCEQKRPINHIVNSSNNGSGGASAVGTPTSGGAGGGGGGTNGSNGAGNGNGGPPELQANQSLELPKCVNDMLPV